MFKVQEIRLPLGNWRDMETTQQRPNAPEQYIPWKCKHWHAASETSQLGSDLRERNMFK